MKTFVRPLLLALLICLVPAGPALALEKTFTNGVGMEFVLIPAGQFTRTWTAKNDFEEEVQHQQVVTISRPFYLGKYEVTQKQWVEVMGEGSNRSSLKRRDHPVEHVSWNDAQEFVQKLNEREGSENYRLPTEAEWEHAARAGTDTLYFFGNDISQLKQYAWFGGDTYHAVGLKKPNPWGLYDIYGNLDEWVQDQYGRYQAGAATDPTGPESGPGLVSRGGTWCYFYDNVPISEARRYDDPHYRTNVIGFRVALALDEAQLAELEQAGPKAAEPSAETPAPAAPDQVNNLEARAEVQPVTAPAADPADLDKARQIAENIRSAVDVFLDNTAIPRGMYKQLEALPHNPQLDAARIRAARELMSLYALTHDFDAAEEIFQELDSLPNSPEVFREKARAGRLMMGILKSANEWERSTFAIPDFGTNLTEDQVKARALERDTAREKILAAIEKYPQDPETDLEKARLLVDLTHGSMETSLEMYKRLEGLPRSPELDLERARAANILVLHYIYPLDPISAHRLYNSLDGLARTPEIDALRVLVADRVINLYVFPFANKINLPEARRIYDELDQYADDPLVDVSRARAAATLADKYALWPKDYETAGLILRQAPDMDWYFKKPAATPEEMIEKADLAKELASAYKGIRDPEKARSILAQAAERLRDFPAGATAYTVKEARLKAAFSLLEGYIGTDDEDGARALVEKFKDLIPPDDRWFGWASGNLEQRLKLESEARKKD